MNRTSIENLMHRAGRTPALLAAILIFLSQASFCCGLIPAGLAVITIALGLGLFAILLDCPDAAAPLFAAVVFSMLLAIPVTDNASSAFTAPSGYGRYKVTVTSSELRLDGAGSTASWTTEPGSPLSCLKTYPPAILRMK